MTSEDAKCYIRTLLEVGGCDGFDYKQKEALDMAIKALEQTDKIEESNFSTEQYKADLQGAYDCGYISGYADAMDDIAESESTE